MGHCTHFQKMKSEAAIHNVGRTTRICFQAGCAMRPSSAKSGRRHRRGNQVTMRSSLGSEGGLSGGTACSSGIRENVEEKDLLRVVKGGGWWEQRLTRGENTMSVWVRARRPYSGAQAGMAVTGARAARRRI